MQLMQADLNPVLSRISMGAAEGAQMPLKEAVQTPALNYPLGIVVKNYIPPPKPTGALSKR